MPRAALPSFYSAILAFGFIAACGMPQAVAEGPVDFNFDVKTILSDRCYVCHGPDAEAREADLRLDLQANSFGDAQSGNADKIIVPGNLAESELWLRISSDDPDMVMPPADSNLRLTQIEIETLGDWIKQGADWKQHWSFVPIRPAPLPDSVQHDEAVDHFVVTKLKTAGHELADPATIAQLIRRVTFDLTGLPPSIDEVDAFLADASDSASDASYDSAYERVVDRLLAASTFGERMASQWLDVARYSDTYGYQVDRDRFVWPYRDWVISAFNENRPYDQFITEQLAGDLLPNATDDQILATTFNRLHPQKVEGGSVPEEFRIEYVADRTQTFSTAIMGLTFECARCHDHKYDPLTQKEYYQLTAFFDKIDEAGLYSYFTPSIPTPTLLLNDQDSKSKLQRLAAAVATETATLAQLRTDLRAAFDTWRQEHPQPVAIPDPIEHKSFEDLKAKGPNKPVAGVVGQAVKLTGDDAINLKTGNFQRYEPFSVALWLKTPTSRERTVVFHRSRAWTDAGSRGYELLLKDDKLSASLIHFWPGNAISIQATDPLPINKWQHVTLTYDGSSKAAGLALYLNGERMPTKLIRDNLYKQITGGGNDHLTIGERFRDIGFRDGLVDEFKVYDRELTAMESRYVFDETTLEQRWKQAANSDAGTEPELFALFLSQDEAFQTQLEMLTAARKAHCDQLADAQEIMVMREMAQPRETYVLGRGAYDAPTDRVTADTPDALPAMPKGVAHNRLGLSKWLTDPDHPLTARVAINRLWQLVFGEGLVRTPEDFGSQGQLPTHPELLDWMARDFITHGWDTKRAVKQLVMSKTYRQSSIASVALLEQDPENLLLGRAPSYRWPAEMLRDQALAISGLLIDKMGGAPAKPYELSDSFKPTKPDTGEGLYRRSVYTYWKRTGPAPAMMALDAAKREVCRVRRSRTSSPLQTLVLMNGPQFVEAARGVAETVLPQSADIDEQLRRLFRTMVGRQPHAPELNVLKTLHTNQREYFAANPTATDEYLEVGAKALPAAVDKTDLAALSAVANALFGLDECMMKR